MTPNTWTAPSCAGSPSAPTRDQARFTYVQVSDDGPGIDRATQARIFEPFYTNKQNGRGLGVAEVQGIIRSHHGALLLTSQPGRERRSRLPLEPTQAAAKLA